MKEASNLESTREKVWRRPLTTEESDQLWRSLGTSPEARATWEEEQRLSLMLERLPDVPLPPRFTEQVLAALAHTPTPCPEPGPWWNWLKPATWPLPSWAPGLAVGLAFVVAVPALWLYRHGEERTRVANSVVHIVQPVHQVGLAVRLSGVEILRDFEAIDRMRQLSSLADEELLASLEFGAP